MTTGGTLCVTEGLLRSETVWGAEGGIEPRSLKFPSEAILSETNVDASGRTNVVHVNGSSNALRVELGKFLVIPPAQVEIREFFRAVQKWEGHVTWVGKDTFAARLVAIAGEGPDQEAEIDMEELDGDDVKLVEEGAVFYWSIGYLDRPAGRLRASVLRFRRLPVWTYSELQKADRKAEAIKDLFKNADQADSTAST